MDATLDPAHKRHKTSTYLQTEEVSLLGAHVQH